MLTVRAALYKGEDPYLDFDTTKHAVDIQGWGSDHQFFGQIITAVRPSIILEVGTWKGASAINISMLCQQNGLETEIICIDTWLGSPEHVLDGAYYASLKHQNGLPQIYYTFIANVISKNLQGYITPFPMASEGAAVVLRALNVKADIVYIDAAHEYESVCRDAAAFWPLLSDSGIMIFDDYGYSDVTKAACKFAASQEKALYASYGKAFITKGRYQPVLTLNSL